MAFQNTDQQIKNIPVAKTYERIRAVKLERRLVKQRDEEKSTPSLPVYVDVERLFKTTHYNVYLAGEDGKPTGAPIYERPVTVEVPAEDADGLLTKFYELDAAHPALASAGKA